MKKDLIICQKGKLRELWKKIIAFFSASIVKGSRIEIRGFGTFSSKVRGARIGRNPSTGEKIYIKEKNVIYFNPSKKLKRLINEKINF